MIAKVKTDNGVYDTIVFAQLFNKWKSQIIGFDEKLEKICFIRHWSKKQFLSLAERRNIFIYDISTIDSTWIHDKKICGFSWLISDKTLLRKIKKGRRISDQIMKNCRRLQSKVSFQNEFHICNEQDIENLLCVAQGFHDSYVESLIQNDDNMVILMNTTWGCKIMFTLKQVEYNNIEVDYGKLGEIFSSSMFIEEGFIYWVDEKFVKSSNEIGPEYRYFKAKEVEWRLIII